MNKARITEPCMTHAEREAVTDRNRNAVAPIGREHDVEFQFEVVRDILNYLVHTRKYPHQIVYGLKEHEFDHILMVLNSK